jgi:alpha-amylase
MKAICLYFQVHQPLRLRRYRFFEIGNEHYYYDDYTNESITQKIAKECYLPANAILLNLIQSLKGKFKLSFSITGLALDQFEHYAPEVIESFQKLAATGYVEFLAETYSHSLASLNNKDEFAAQVQAHSQHIERLFGQKPQIFRNTELIYSDNIGELIAKLGFKGILAGGPRQLIKSNNPNYLYSNFINPNLRVLMRNKRLSDAIASRFENKNGLTAERFTKLLNKGKQNGNIVNIFLDYEIFNENQTKNTSMLDFFTDLPKVILSNTEFEFATFSEIVDNQEPVAAINVPQPISWNKKENNLSAWQGNDLQKEASCKLYLLRNSVLRVDNTHINMDWKFLQSSDHFYYMNNNFFTDGDIHNCCSPYNSPYDAFINYMNILSDFKNRITELNMHEAEAVPGYEYEKV